MSLVRRRPRFDRRTIVLPLALAAVWIAVSVSGLANPLIVVPPRQLLAGFAQSAVNPEFWTAVGSSLLRLLGGWTIGTLAGIVIGVAIGCSRRTGRVVSPSLNAVRQVALFAWIPLLTAWFGDGEIAKLILIAVAAFFPTALNTESGCRQAPQTLIEVGRVLEFGPWTTLRRIILPSALPSIAAGLQIGLTSAWIGTIGAEYLIDQGTGLGVFLASARLDNRMDVVVVCMVALGAIGYALNSALRRGFAGRTAPEGVVVVDD